ncbi:MAG: type II secretion system protein M [Burkholderiales bacterium]
MNFAWTASWRGRWKALAARERQAISGLGAFFGVIIFYLAVWNPVHEGLAKARARVAVSQAHLVQVKGQAALVASARNAPRASPPANLLEAVQDAAERNGIRAQLKRVDGEGARGVRVQFEGASLSGLLACLVDLQQRSGMRAERATLERQANPGTVNAQLVLRAHGP